MSGNEYSISIGGSVTGGHVAAGERVTQVHVADGRAADQPKVVVLFLAANPDDTDALMLDEEVRAVDRRLREGQVRDRFDLRQQWAVRATDLSEALLRYRPTIVHFSGHGSPDGRIMLLDDDRMSVLPPIDAVADLFRIAGGAVRCVVLNACHSRPLAEAIGAHVDCVAGTSREIADDDAVRFAAGFYRALSFGESVQTAFDLGRNEIELAGEGDGDVVELVARAGVDPAEVRLTTQA